MRDLALIAIVISVLLAVFAGCGYSDSEYDSDLSQRLSERERENSLAEIGNTIDPNEPAGARVPIGPETGTPEDLPSPNDRHADGRFAVPLLIELVSDHGPESSCAPCLKAHSDNIVDVLVERFGDNVLERKPTSEEVRGMPWFVLHTRDGQRKVSGYSTEGTRTERVEECLYRIAIALRNYGEEE